jgi:hypothetical protein
MADRINNYAFRQHNRNHQVFPPHVGGPEIDPRVLTRASTPFSSHPCGGSHTRQGGYPFHHRKALLFSPALQGIFLLSLLFTYQLFNSLRPKAYPPAVKSLYATPLRCTLFIPPRKPNRSPKRQRRDKAPTTGYKIRRCLLKKTIQRPVFPTPYFFLNVTLSDYSRPIPTKTCI